MLWLENNDKRESIFKGRDCEVENDLNKLKIPFEGSYTS